jgi:hypothetical protein
MKQIGEITTRYAIMVEDEFFGTDSSGHGFDFGPFEIAKLYPSKEEAQENIEFSDERVVTIHEVVYLIEG